METRESVLYNSILKGSLEREDVKELEREMSRDFYEVYQDLQKSHDHYKGTATISWASLVTVLFLLVFYSNFKDDVRTSQISCNIYEVPFICVLSNTKFFSVRHPKLTIKFDES